MQLRHGSGRSDVECDEPSGVRVVPGARVLLVGDSADSIALMQAIEAAGFAAHAVPDAHAALRAAVDLAANAVLFHASARDPALADVIAQIKARSACACLLLVDELSGAGITLANECGADGILVTPLQPVALRRWLQHESVSRAGGRAPSRSADLPASVIGTSREMREVWRLMLAAAQSSSSVLVLGETGTGKEVVARAVHRFSCGRSGPFVAVNCAALPETLLESELFGHEKGAFTGATAQRKGRFELANGGTLFLDEIGDLPLGLQVKLLRVLQEHAFERVGGTQTVHVDVRVIAATHRDLAVDIEHGRFRADLFYRLNVLCVRVPPLRERPSDVIGLWEHFIREGAASEGRPAPETTPAVQRLLIRHAWPGNVRELHNVALNVLALATGAQISPHDLPEALRVDVSEPRVLHGLLGLTLKEIENLAIRQTYEAFGTVKATAEVLAISPRKIHYRLAEQRAQLRKHDERSAATSLPTVDAGHVHAHVRRVLLAERDDDLRSVLATLLETDGYEVTQLPEGGVSPHGASPEVIVIDEGPSGATALEILERVRAHSR